MPSFSVSRFFFVITNEWACDIGVFDALILIRLVILPWMTEFFRKTSRYQYIDAFFISIHATQRHLFSKKEGSRNLWKGSFPRADFYLKHLLQIPSSVMLLVDNR